MAPNVGEPEVAYFNGRDRPEQLRAFAAVSHELAQAIRAYDDRLGQTFAALACGARDLLHTGFSQADLTELSQSFPVAPHWLSPKALDAGLALEPWQQAAAPLFKNARRLALDLRTLGTY